MESLDLRPLIGGERRSTENRVDLRDPYRGERIGEVHLAGDTEIEAAVASARRGVSALGTMPLHERTSALRRAAQLLAEGRDQVARSISIQTGKALRDATGEVARGSVTLATVASAAEQLNGEILQADAVPRGEGLMILVLREPLGVVAAITPFNAPVNLPLHKVAAALAVGNSVILKPAPAAPWSALQVAEILLEAGFPEAAVNVLFGDAGAARRLAGHGGVDGVSFTGSPEGGRAIQLEAGPKRTVLELGGNSPNIIYEDADLGAATTALVTGSFSNTGQSCNSVQRVILHRRVCDELTERMVAAARKLVVGDPLDASTEVGSMVSEEAAVRVERAIRDATLSGAQLLCGGERNGAAVTPTLILDRDRVTSLQHEEIFGPVAVLATFSDLDEAIAIANATPYGLQAAVFTSSLHVAITLARRIRAGGVMVNRSSNFRLDHMPFGGMQSSGIGREGGRFSLEELTHRKVVLIDPGSAA